jgi:antitoxin component YwqK of YwqJK toxin-antitoxin module
MLERLDAGRRPAPGAVATALAAALVVMASWTTPALGKRLPPGAGPRRRTLEEGVRSPGMIRMPLQPSRLSARSFVRLETPTGALILHQAQLDGLADQYCGAVAVDGAFRATSARGYEMRYGCKGGQRDGRFEVVRGGVVAQAEVFRRGVLVSEEATSGDERVVRTRLKPELEDESPLRLDTYRGKVLVMRVEDLAERRAKAKNELGSQRRTTFYPNGAKAAEMRLAQGQPAGPARFWHENGQLLAAGPFNGPWMTGEWEIHHANGQLRARGSFERTKSGASARKGPWTFYDENGEVLAKIDMPGETWTPAVEGRWFNDVMDGGGYPQLAVAMSGQQRDGDFVQWHANGQVRVRGHYVKGSEDGDWTYRHRDGSPATSDRDSLK